MKKKKAKILDNEDFFKKLNLWRYGVFSLSRKSIVEDLRMQRSGCDENSRVDEDFLPLLVEYVRNSQLFEPVRKRLKSDMTYAQTVFFLYYLSNELFGMRRDITAFLLTSSLFNGSYENIKEISKDGALLKSKILIPCRNSDGYCEISPIVIKEIFGCDINKKEHLVDFFARSKDRRKSFLLTKEKIDVDFYEDIELAPEIREKILDAVLIHKKLSDIRSDQRYKKIQKFIEKNVILFYGPPGTGKTITAKAIAGLINEPLYSVNIAQTRSCWVGESEKLIEQIFTEFKSKRKGILFFDEADSIFSTRIKGIKASVDSMHNRTINILLQGIEKIRGMVILTTNNNSNFDPAFERRIGLKLAFEYPDIELRRKLWQKKLELFSLEDKIDIEDLIKYEMSPAEMENVLSLLARYFILHEDELGSKEDAQMYISDLIAKQLDYYQKNSKIGFKPLDR